MRELNINGTELKIFGSGIDEAVIEETIEMIKGSPTLFKGETIVLMPDAHSTGGTPVGFTCTCTNGLLAPDLVSADVSCGMTSILIENYVPNKKALTALAEIIRDIVPINRKLRADISEGLTSHGTLGGGEASCHRMA